MNLDAKFEIPKQVIEALKGLTDKETRTMLRKAMQESTGSDGVLVRHWEEGQGKWDRPEDKTGPLFYESGDAFRAMHDIRSKYRKTRVSKARKSGEWRASVALRKMDGKHNVYAIAQKGKFMGLDKKGRRISKQQMLISANLPGDERIVTPHLVNAIIAELKKKGML